MAELSIVAWANSPSYRPASATNKPRGRVRNGMQITPTRERILAALDHSLSPMSASKIRLAADIAMSTAKVNIAELVQARLVREVDRLRAPHGGPSIPLYALTEHARGVDE